MEKFQLDFNFTAPYFKTGLISEQTKKVWIIFHGYAQLVEDFQEGFSNIDLDENVLIFPQGLSKFYMKGIDKKIGASWMTANDREFDIQNYINYLDKIYQMEIQPFLKRINLNILGFSQGVHTASRWIYQSGISYQKFIAWGAGLAHEIDKEIIKKSFSQGYNYFVIGDKDRFISQEALEKMKDRYRIIGLDYKLIQYQGTHDIYPEVLKDLV